MKSLVTALFESKQEAALLVDDNGLYRVAGRIMQVYEQDEEQNTIILIGEEETQVLLKDIVGINGTFHSDYTDAEELIILAEFAFCAIFR